MCIYIFIDDCKSVYIVCVEPRKVCKMTEKTGRIEVTHQDHAARAVGLAWSKKAQACPVSGSPSLEVYSSGSSLPAEWIPVGVSWRSQQLDGKICGKSHGPMNTCDDRDRCSQNYKEAKICQSLINSVQLLGKQTCAMDQIWPWPKLELLLIQDEQTSAHSWNPGPQFLIPIAISVVTTSH